MTEKRKAYEEACDAELSQWDLELAMLKGKTAMADNEIKTSCQKTIQALEKNLAAAKARLLELRSAGQEAWEDPQTTMETARMNLKISFCGLAAKLEAENIRKM